MVREMTIETLATFLGWCSVINIGLLLFGGLLWVLLKDGLSEFVGKFFGVTEDEVKLTFFHVLMHYRTAILFLNLVPYVALKIMV